VGNIGVSPAGRERVVAHDFPRTCEGRQRCDLWSAYLFPTDNGLLAPAKWIAALRSCANC
jgi:hypothetical protein